VFFTDVRVPAMNLLGPLNEGWTVTRTTLGHQRAGVAVFAARFEKHVREIIATAAAKGVADPVRADRLGRPWASDTLPPRGCIMARGSRGRRCAAGDGC
jgi:alkylation response protein AidB-like acyl-CoA dehydrogenase